MVMRMVSDILSTSGLLASRSVVHGTRAYGSPVFGYCIRQAARCCATQSSSVGEQRPFQWLGLSETDAAICSGDGHSSRGVNAAPQQGWGKTEIHGSFHDIVGKRRLKDLFEAMGPEIDGIKFAGTAVMAMQRRGVLDAIAVAHEHGAYAACAGGIELAWEQGEAAVQRWLTEAGQLTFNAVEFGCGDLSDEQVADLVRQVKQAGLQARPKVGTRESVELGIAKAGRMLLRAAMTFKPTWVTHQAQCCAEAGADAVVVNGEDLMEIASWDGPAIQGLIDAVGMHRLLFEAPHAEVFEWLVSAFGPGVNLSVDDRKLLQLQELRAAGARMPRVRSHARDGDSDSELETSDEEAGLNETRGW